MEYKQLGDCEIHESDSSYNSYNKIAVNLHPSKTKRFIVIHARGSSFELLAKDAWWLARMLDQAVKEAVKEDLAPTKLR